MLSLTSPVKTPYHRIPPGPKLAILSVFTFVLFLVGSLAFQAVALSAVAVLYLVPGQMFWRQGLRMLRPLWLFVVIVMGWHGLTGDAALGLGISLRMMAAVALANLVTMTTRLDDLTAFVRWLLRPFERFGLPTHHLSLAISLFVRFTPVLIEKGTVLIESWRSRSGKRPNWRVIVPMALLAVDDAEHIAEALRARGGMMPDKPKGRPDGT